MSQFNQSNDYMHKMIDMVFAIKACNFMIANLQAFPATGVNETLSNSDEFIKKIKDKENADRIDFVMKTMKLMCKHINNFHKDFEKIREEYKNIIENMEDETFSEFLQNIDLKHTTKQ